VGFQNPGTGSGLPGDAALWYSLIRPPIGLKPSWVANNHRDHQLFRVCPQIDDDYQVFVDTP
jgi:hypothetical protein